MKTLLILSSLLLISIPGWAADPCWRETLQSLFQIEPKAGDLLDQKQAKRVLPNGLAADEVRLLGQGGGSGAVVYRVKIGAETKVLKKVSLKSALNDESAFHVLREAAEGQSDVHVVTSKLYPVSEKSPQSLGSSSTWMELEDVKGKTLFSVLNDRSLPREVRADLVKRYDAFLDHLRKNLNQKRSVILVRQQNQAGMFPAELPEGLSDLEKFELIQYQPKSMGAKIPINQLQEEFKPLYQMLKQVSGTRIQLFESERNINILLKSDNFLVTPDYKLYLIDPY